MEQDAINAILETLPKNINKNALLLELARVREDRFRISCGEVFVGAVSVAAPYFDYRHRVIGSIGAFGPEARLNEEWVSATVRRVMASADELSAALGRRYLPEPTSKEISPSTVD